MKRRNTIALSVLAFVLLVLGFYQTPLMSHARMATWDIIVHRVAHVAGVGPLSTSGSAMDRNDQLLSENIRLRGELQHYKTITRQLGSPSFDDMDHIPSEVLMRPIDTFQSQYVLNKGERDGIVIDAPVVVHGSTLVGFISHINESTSVVDLLLHPSTHVTVESLVSEEDMPRARGILQSVYQTSLLATTIPRDAFLEERHEFVTTSQGPLIPQGLYIGTVSSIHNPEHEAYQEATIRIPYDPDSIQAVHILVPRN